MYHGVSGKKNFSINGRHLPALEFEKHLKYFKQNFDVLPLKELCAKPQHKNGKRAVALTFDDGYFNNIQHAIPLLLKYRMPATFFVSTISLTDNQYLHPADYIDIIAKSKRGTIDINGIQFPTGNQQLLNSKETAYTYINSLGFEDFKTMMDSLKRQYRFDEMVKEIDPEVYKLTTNETVADLLSDSLFSVGSHGHDHINLSMLSQEELAHQLSVSKKILESHTQTSVDVLAFPYGYFNKDVVKASAEQGYQYTFAGGSVKNECRQHVFPRIGILNMGGYAFNMLSINRGFQHFGF